MYSILIHIEDVERARFETQVYEDPPVLPCYLNHDNYHTKDCNIFELPKYPELLGYLCPKKDGLQYYGNAHPTTCGFLLHDIYKSAKLYKKDIKDEIDRDDGVTYSFKMKESFKEISKKIQRNPLGDASIVNISIDVKRALKAYYDLIYYWSHMENKKK